MTSDTTPRSGQQLIKDARSRIEELDPTEVKEILDHRGTNGDAAEAPVILDVREQQEYEMGHIPGAVHIPRGHLETRIEQAIPDRHQRVIAYCSTQNRSALAAVTMKELLGYDDVSVMTGGFTLWKDRGYDFDRPHRAHVRAARALLPPPADPGGRPRGTAEAARVQGAADRRRRARLAGRPVSGRGGRRHARHRRQRRGRPVQPAAPGHPQQRAHRHAQGRVGQADDRGAEPRRERDPACDTSRQGQRARPDPRLRRDRRRRRQLPHALPAERRRGARAQARRARVDPRASTGSSRPSCPTRARATAACTRSHRPPSWRRHVARTACWACCPASWACCRPTRSSSS